MCEREPPGEPLAAGQADEQHDGPAAGRGLGRQARRHGRAGLHQLADELYYNRLAEQTHNHTHGPKLSQ